MSCLNIELPKYQMDTLRQKYLLRKVNKLAQQGLSELLSHALNDSCEALISMANGVEPDLQRLYFDSLCRLYGKKEALLEGFGNVFSTHYYAAVNRCLSNDVVSAQSFETSDASEKVLLDTLSGNLEEAVSDASKQLQPYLEFILGCPVSAEINPLAPQQLVAIFQDVLAELDASSQVNEIYYHYLQKQLLGGLPPLVIQITEYLKSEMSQGEDAGATNDAENSYILQLTEHLQRNLTEENAAIVQRKVAAAIASVDVAVSQLIVGQVVVEPVVSLLRGPWKTLMAAILIEEGTQSIRWEVCLEVTRELVCSIQPIESPDQRQQLVKHIPRLIQMLRINLEEITWIKLDSQRLFAELEQLHLSQLRGSISKQI